MHEELLEENQQLDIKTTNPELVAANRQLEGAPGALKIGLAHYQIKWNAMGANSRSRGKVVTFTKIGLNS